MQPYFFPYIGYFQLIQSVDVFIVYDNIKYTKKGWINRNRIQNAGREAVITLPLKNAPDHLDIREREIAEEFARDKLLNRISGAYRRAPHFGEVFPLVSRDRREQGGKPVSISVRFDRQDLSAPRNTHPVHGLVGGSR